MTFLPKTTPAALLTLILTLAFAIAPAVTPPFKGYRDDQLPFPQPDPAIQPAGYAFAIWGVIYSWLLFSAVYGVWKRGDDPEWDAPRRALLPALAIGTFWLWIAGESAIWGSITIAMMAASAIAALLRCPNFDRWSLRTPLALFAGWLTAATHVSIGVTLAGYGIGFSADIWAYICIASALLIGLIVQLKRADAPEYGLTLIWALIAIVIDAQDSSPDVGMAAGAAALLTAIVLIAQYIKKGRS